MEKSMGLVILFAAVIQFASSNLTQMQALQQLQNADITVNGLCAGYEFSDCVSLEGIRADTINGLVELQDKSRCPLEITAGMESGHYNKGTYTKEKVYGVRIANNNCIHKYITTHSKCKRYIKDGMQVVVCVVGCEDKGFTAYSLIRRQWSIWFFPEDMTFFGKLSMTLRGWKVSKTK